MAVITLTTDFGTSDEYSGVMKGVILSVNPSAVIVDITHQIDPQDVLQTALIIKSAYPYFPKHSIHVIIVDPGVGSDRSILALQKNGHTFLAPDNGVLTLILEDGNYDLLVKVNNPRYFLETVSHTFHGRDIFAPTAAHLSNGIPFENLGDVVGLNQIHFLQIPKPNIKNESADGVILSIDRFGNLITNIDAACLDAIGVEKELLDIHIGNTVIQGISASYSSVGLKKPLAVIGSRGYLEVSVNCGNAETYFQTKQGDPIKIQKRRVSESEISAQTYKDIGDGFKSSKI